MLVSETTSGAEQVQEKIVRVSFDPSAPVGKQFTFENYLTVDRGLSGQPGDVEMRGPGDIVFTRLPANAPWSFVTAAVKNPGDQFKVRVPKTGTLLIIHDDWLENGTFPYLLIVQDADGQHHASPDPVIVNTDPA